MAWYKKFLIFLGIFLIIGFAGGYWFVLKYDAIVKQVVITNLNKSLASEVEVKNVKFSIYSSFPYASLDFEDVLIRENTIVIGKPDTLIFANSIKLNFNVIDIYNGQYNIKRIIVEQGVSKIKLNQEGVGNYNIIKPNTDSTSENFSLALEEVILKNLIISYNDELNKLSTSGHVKDLSAIGFFSSAEFDLNLSGFIENISYRDENLKEIKLTSLKPNFGLTINNSANTYFFKPSEAIINGLHSISFTGKILDPGYEFKIDGHQLNPISFSSILNTDWATQLAEYEVDGIIDLTLNISSNTKQKLNFNLFYKFQNGQFQLDDEGSLIRGVFAKGFYKPSWKGEFEKGNITVDSLFIPLKEGELFGNLLIENIKTPKFTANLTADLSFKGPFSVFNPDSSEAIYGDYKVKGKMVLPLWRWSFNTNDLQKLQFEDLMAIGENIIIPLDENRKISIEKILSKLSNKKAEITDLQMKLGNSDFSFNGELINYWSYLFSENQKLFIKGSLYANNLIFEDFSAGVPQETSNNSSFLPQNIAASLQGRVNHFEYGTFTSDSVSGKFLISPSLFKASQLSLKTMEGYLSTDLKLQPSSNNQLLFEARGTTEHINISTLFKSFKNFEQDYIRSDHLEGFATSKFNGKGEIDNQFFPNYKSLEAVVELEIKNGKLKGFEPLQEINTYFKEQAVLKRLINTDEFGKRVTEIEVSDLKNTLQLKNSVVTIPSISVASSVMDIAVEGTHSFENEIDYSLSFNLRDLMMKEKTSTTEFGEIEDDGLGGKIIYLKIKGTTEKFDIEWDKKKKREAQKQEFEKEKAVIKEILKQEFTNSEKETEPEEKAFEIEWEEFENQNDTALENPQQDTTAIKKKKGGFLKKILENPEEKQKKPEVIFDDDF